MPALQTVRSAIVIPNYILADQPDLVETIMMRAEEDVLRELTKQVPLAEGLFIHSRTWHSTPNLPWDNTHTYYLDTEYERTEMRQEAVYVTPQYRPAPDRPASRHCRWCGSAAPDDKRGNCGACGGPRL